MIWSRPGTTLEAGEWHVGLLTRDLAKFEIVGSVGAAFLEQAYRARVEAFLNGETLRQ